MSQRVGQVFIVDDDDAVRDALQRLFASVEISTSAYGGGEEFLSACADDAIGCLLLDLRMPGMGAFDVLEEIAARNIALLTIIITGHGDVETGVRAIKAGASDFLEKPFKEQALIEMVQKALIKSGEDFDKLKSMREFRACLDKLTSREGEVLDWVVRGEANKRIAFTLGLSEKTIEFHRANLMKKLEARSLADLIQKTITAR